jgi:hypothetical protein
MAGLAKCPNIIPTLVIADDPYLAAQVSCRLANAGAYVPIVEGPRMSRPDSDAEVIRRYNVAARAAADEIVLAGLSANASAALAARFANKRVTQIATVQQADARWSASFSGGPIRWGRDRVALGLLQALRARRDIAFDDKPSAAGAIPSRSGHLVVCEDLEPVPQIIAANYAFALGAGLCLIPATAKDRANEILEYFYNIYEDQQLSPASALEQLKTQLRNICGPLPIPSGGSITFITGGLPYGFAFPEVPTTHLFDYPDLGMSVINGLAAEQPKSRGVSVAVLVDPGTTPAPEVDIATKVLPPRGVFVRGYRGPGADVRNVSDMIELFPYDLLIIATHCGDAPGYRWTYKFKDAEGLDRELIVDIAIGVARTNDNNLLRVTQFVRFVALDGIDWNDPEKADKVYVGTAITEYLRRSGSKGDLEPVTKEDIPRVLGSAALKMFDHNFIAIPKSLADEGTPIIINNACASWHRLAETFTFCNARAYVGTLFSVTSGEASEVATKLLEKHFQKPLPAALWAAQRDVYGESTRRPYVVTGIYTQFLRTARRDVPTYIGDRLTRALAAWEAQLAQIEPGNDRLIKGLQERVDFYKREIENSRRNWGAPRPKGLAVRYGR